MELQQLQLSCLLVLVTFITKLLQTSVEKCSPATQSHQPTTNMIKIEEQAIDTYLWYTTSQKNSQVIIIFTAVDNLFVNISSNFTNTYT